MLLDLFLNRFGSYNKELQFRVILIIVMIIFFFTYFYPNNFAYAIILLVFAVYIGDWYVKFDDNKISDFNQLTLIKLQKLQLRMNTFIETKIKQITNETRASLTQKEIDNIYKRAQLDSLYIDSNMIIFLESIINMSDYNPEEFFKLLKSTNKILKIRETIEEYKEKSHNNAFPTNISQQLEIAIKIKKKAMNHMHNFIYTAIPQGIPEKYLTDSMYRFNVLLSRNIDILYDYYKKALYNRGISNNTHFVDEWREYAAKPIDGHEGIDMNEFF